ncbi:MAG TPA: serine hydrolase domain-containing protein [Gemmatimonadaceae bacterium]|nr:serine hydrolase domain-containing protein [Gemmatimonadaceae bacterium]
MRSRRFGAMCAFVACTTPLDAQPGAAVVRGNVAATIDTFLTRATAYGLSGAIVVARDGEIVLRKGYGNADRERGVAITPETPFFVGSLAKQFTAAATLRLAADGKVALGDTLGRFFPDAPADKRAITVRQLLAHTSGLPYLPSAGLFGRGTRDSVMREMLAEPLAFPPGSRYAYSTPGYNLLAGIIEQTSGVSYEQYLRTLFERAGLRSTGFVGERSRWRATPVRSYSDDAAEAPLEDVPAIPRFVGAGSIVSTVDDLYLWYDALMGGHVLPAAERDSLFAPVVRIAPTLLGALTWMLVSLPTGTLRQAAGDIGGFNAEIRHYVDERMVVVFASNARVRGRGFREIVLNYVARMSRGESIPAPPVVAPVSEEDRRELAGAYEMSDSGAVEIWTSGDSLLIGARDAAGLAVLAGHSADQARRAQSLDAQTRRFLASLGNDSLAMEFLHAGIPADSRRAYLVKMREVMGDSVETRVSVIGTAVDSPMGARSYVRIRRAGGDEIVSLVWNGGMLVGVEPAGRAAYTLALRGEGDGELTSFDLFTGHLVRVSRVAEREVKIESSGVIRRALLR